MVQTADNSFDEASTPQWRRDGALYYPLSARFKSEFGAPVRKVSLDAHFSCPNIDGTVGRGGCIFCDAVSFSPSRRIGLDDLVEQLEDGIARLKRRFNADKFIAYFQPSTNTCAPVDVLEKAYRSVLNHPEVVGIAIGTRPDAVPEPVLELLQEIAKEKWLVLELGLQTSNDATLRWLNRGHDYACFVDAVARAQRRGIRLGAHLILGLPGETRNDVLTTARRVAAMNLYAVKLHNLHVVKNTRLAEMARRGEVPLPTLEEYTDLVVDFIERLGPDAVVERVAGDASPEFLIAPEWTAVRGAGRAAVDAALKRRKTWQGRLFDPDWREGAPVF